MYGPFDHSFVTIPGIKRTHGWKFTFQKSYAHNIHFCTSLHFFAITFFSIFRTTIFKEIDITVENILT